MKNISISFDHEDAQDSMPYTIAIDGVPVVTLRGPMAALHTALLYRAMQNQDRISWLDRVTVTDVLEIPRMKRR